VCVIQRGRASFHRLVKGGAPPASSSPGPIGGSLFTGAVPQSFSEANKIYFEGATLRSYLTSSHCLLGGSNRA
jgi:hypothetical protein